MAGHLEGSDSARASSPAREQKSAAACSPPRHLEEPQWSRLLLGLVAPWLPPHELPLAWQLGPDSASAFFERGSPPVPPFAPGAGDGTWVVARSPEVIRSAEADAAAGERGGPWLPSSQSGLVTLWSKGGSRCLLDVLAARSLVIDGPPIAVGFTLADVVVELASRRWSDIEEVHLVGLGREIPGLDSVRFLRDLDDAASLLKGAAEAKEHRSRCFVVAPGISDRRARRALCDLIALAEQIPSTAVVCCDTAVRARCTWHLSSHRETLRFEVRTRSRSTAILSPGRFAEHRAVAPRNPLRGASSGGRPADRPAAVPDDWRATPDHRRVAAADPRAARGDRPVVAQLAVHAVAPVLPASDGVEISFLGPVQVIGACESLESRRRLTELIVYIGFHSEGVTGEALATALWPDRRVPLQTVANRLYEARRALGTTPDGYQRLTRTDGRHKLAGDATTDWHRFCSLTAAGSGPTGWRRALSLVRGRPFEGLPRGEWVGLEGAAARIEAEIVEVADSLGEHFLARGDPIGATWAARRGIVAAPWEERLYRLLMRAADASGSRGGVEAAVRLLAQSLDWRGDPLEAVHPATAALYRSLTGTGERPRPATRT